MDIDKLEDFKTIKEYIEARIRIDGTQDGFAKGLAEGNIKMQHSKVLYAIARHEMFLKNIEP